MESIGQLSSRPSACSVGGKRRALILGDDMIAVEAMATTLSQSGFATRFAIPVSTEHLDDAVQQWRPDLVLLDVDYLSTSSAVDLLAILRREDVPVALLTERTDLPIIRDLGSTEAAVVIDKSSAAPEVVQTLHTLLTVGLDVGVRDGDGRSVGSAATSAMITGVQLRLF